jgi:hypothetical protein
MPAPITFALNPNATTTIVPAACIPSAVVIISPQTQHAATDRTTTSVVAGIGSFKVTHARNPRADRAFGFVVVV